MTDLLSALAPAGARPELDALPARDLSRAELRDLVARLAADPASWSSLVAEGRRDARPDARYYLQVHRDTQVDVWLICWNVANDTGWHDHDISSGAVAVMAGALTERLLSLSGPERSRDVVAGQDVDFGPEHIHRLVGRDPGTVSIHAYSPPLWRMGQYAISTTGVLRRTSVSYADELRPLDEPA